MTAIDILTKNNLPIIVDGDLVLGASDHQHIQHILFSQQGCWRQFPLVGADIKRFENEIPNQLSTTLTLSGDIIKQLKYDGFRLVQVVNPSVTNPILNVER